jgi:hypothetical protein
MNRNNKTRKSNKNRLNNSNKIFRQIYGLNNNENTNNILNDIILPSYYELITDIYSYNVKIEYGNDIDIVNIIQLNNSFIECVVLSVPHDGDIADLLNVNYYSSCSKNFQKSTGTVHMVNTLLKYVIDNYPHIKSFKLKDTTNINNEIDNSVETPFFVTTRRLLKGELGWYEEKFGAVPIGDTIDIISFLRLQRNTFNDIIPMNKPNSWWTEENTSSIIKKICLHTTNINPGLLQKIIYFTEWSIPSKNIKDVVYTIRPLKDINNANNNINNIINNMKSMKMRLKRNNMKINE